MTRTVDTLPALKLERTVAATRAVVWHAWTDAAMLARWWGPKDFVTPRCVFEARAGGEIAIDMLSPDGSIFPMIGRVETASPPERLVFVTTALSSDGAPLFDVRNTLTLEEDAGSTRLILNVEVMAIHTPQADRYLQGMDAGWSQSLERLSARCAPAKTTHGVFTLERRLAVPPAKVFAAFASAEAKSRWFTTPSDQWTLQAREVDFRVGGRERLMGRWASGTVTDYQAVYHDIVPDRRIVYSYGMHINCVRISVSLAVVQVEAEGAGCRLTLTEQGAFLDGYDDAGSRERGTSELLDTLVRSLTSD